MDIQLGVMTDFPYGTNIPGAEKNRARLDAIVEGYRTTLLKDSVGMLREGVDTMLTGDVDTGKAILRDYIKATVGFEKLGEATGTQPKSLIRMFGPRGNPQARNLFGIIGYLQKQAGVALHVSQGPSES